MDTYIMNYRMFYFFFLLGMILYEMLLGPDWAGLFKSAYWSGFTLFSHWFLVGRRR